MAFYLRPPSGNISLEKLSAFAGRRLCFLMKILETDQNNLISTDWVYEDVSLVADSDCLIEGTKKDQISHFILRMAFSENDEMWKWFENAEMILFNFRFLCMQPEEILQCLKPVWRTIARLSWNRDIKLWSLKGALKVLQEIPSSCSWPDVIDKYFSGNDHEYFLVPFLYALQLVSKRKVKVEQGMAQIPFSKLNNVMTSIFQTILQFSRPRFQEIQRKLDERIIKLFHQLQRHLKSKIFKNKFCSEIGFGNLSHESVDSEVKFFPPCMAYHHKELRLKHRLKHQARIRYTLFLKEAGLSLCEALMFWRNEYSHQCKHKDIKCLHSWDKDAKRYIYNIRHLYGLEGGRTNYTAHSCAALQSGCGGCPFVDFDEAHLRDLLSDEKIVSNQENIMELARQNKPSNACSVFFLEKLKSFIQSDPNVFCTNGEQQHHSSNEFSTSHKAPLLKRRRICSRNQSLLKLSPPLNDSCNSKKSVTKTIETDCLQIEKKSQVFSEDSSKSSWRIATDEKKNIVIDNSFQCDRVFPVCSFPPDIHPNSQKSTITPCELSSKANLCPNGSPKNNHKLFTSVPKNFSENLSPNRECKNIAITTRSTQKLSTPHSEHFVDKDCAQFLEDINEIKDLTCCDFHKKIFSDAHFKDNDCNLHKKQQTVSRQKWFEELSKRSESVLKESVTSLHSEKVSCYSSSNCLSESMHKGASPPNSILKANSNIHPNFSDSVFQLQLQLSQQDLNCARKTHARPIEFYKYFKKTFAKPES